MKNKVGEFTLPDFKAYYTRLEDQNGVVPSLRQADQCNRIASPEIKPCIYAIDFPQGAQTI